MGGAGSEFHQQCADEHREGYSDKRVTVRTTVTKTTELSVELSENEVLEAVASFVSVKTKLAFKPSDVDLDISSQGFLRGATVKSSTTDEHSERSLV